jgi:hypothetical protein
MSGIPESRPPQDPEETPIEVSGVISGLEEPLLFHEAKHRAETTRRLAYGVVIGLFGGSWFLFVAMKLLLELYGKHEAAEGLSKDFFNWLPVISSISGGVVAYYFAREKNGI